MRKQKITEISRDLFLKEGIQSVSIDRLCEQMGMSKKSFYKYFESKEELVEVITDQYIEEFEEKILKVVQNSDNEIEELININSINMDLSSKISKCFFIDLKKYYQSILHKIENFNRIKVTSIYLQNINNGKKSGLYRSDFPSEYIAYLYSSGISNVIDYFETNDNQSFSSLKSLYLNYHLRGICTEKGLNVLHKKMFKTNI